MPGNNSQTTFFKSTSINIDIDTEKLLYRLKINKGSPAESKIISLLNKAKSIANPIAIYRETTANRISEDIIEIDHFKFKSKLLATLLSNTSQVYPHIVSCGITLEKWSEEIEDMFLRYCAEEIKSLYLQETITFLNTRIQKKANINSILSSVNPGSLHDWPIDDQLKIYNMLFNKPDADIIISENAVLTPSKSVSGILFHSKEYFTNCMLCIQENCEERRYCYNPDFLDKNFRE